MQLKDSFEDDLQEVVLDVVEQTVREDIGPMLKQTARQNFEAYASRNDYDIDYIWEDAKGPIVDRSDDGVSVRIEWPGLTALFEFGVDPHPTEGNPELHFKWENAPSGAPEWVQTERVNWGSETGGIPESRAVRDAMNWLRAELRR
jgi:hypothetical protein